MSGSDWSPFQIRGTRNEKLKGAERVDMRPVQALNNTNQMFEKEFNCFPIGNLHSYNKLPLNCLEQ